MSPCVRASGWTGLCLSLLVRGPRPTATGAGLVYTIYIDHIDFNCFLCGARRAFVIWNLWKLPASRSGGARALFEVYTCREMLRGSQGLCRCKFRAVQTGCFTAGFALREIRLAGEGQFSAMRRCKKGDRGLVSAMESICKKKNRSQQESLTYFEKVNVTGPIVIFSEFKLMPISCNPFKVLIIMQGLLFRTFYFSSMGSGNHSFREWQCPGESSKSVSCHESYSSVSCGKMG